MFNGDWNGSKILGVAESGCLKSNNESVLSLSDHCLLNGRQLVNKLGVKYDFYKDMRIAGFHPPIAGLTTLAYAMNWLNGHPNFREDASILKRSRKPKLASNLRPQVVDKSGELPSKRGVQRS
jgi:hypothetical protein